VLCGFFVCQRSLRVSIGASGGLLTDELSLHPVKISVEEVMLKTPARARVVVISPTVKTP